MLASSLVIFPKLFNQFFPVTIRFPLFALVAMIFAADRSCSKRPIFAFQNAHSIRRSSDIVGNLDVLQYRIVARNCREFTKFVRDISHNTIGCSRLMCVRHK